MSSLVPRTLPRHLELLLTPTESTGNPLPFTVAPLAVTFPLTGPLQLLVALPMAPFEQTSSEISISETLELIAFDHVGSPFTMALSPAVTLVLTLLLVALPQLLVPFKLQVVGFLVTDASLARFAGSGRSCGIKNIR